MNNRLLQQQSLRFEPLANDLHLNRRQTRDSALTKNKTEIDQLILMSIDGERYDETKSIYAVQYQIAWLILGNIQTTSLSLHLFVDSMNNRLTERNREAKIESRRSSFLVLDKRESLYEIDINMNYSVSLPLIKQIDMFFAMKTSKYLEELFSCENDWKLFLMASEFFSWDPTDSQII